MMCEQHLVMLFKNNHLPKTQCIIAMLGIGFHNDSENCYCMLPDYVNTALVP